LKNAFEALAEEESDEHPDEQVMNERGGHEEKKSEMVVKERVMDEQGGTRRRNPR
jgi:hypothetical protein